MRAVKTGQISFSTIPDASVARYANDGSSHAMLPGSSTAPSSRIARRVIASSNPSPGAGWPQKLLLQTPGQVSLVSDRRVTSTRPSGANR